MSPPPPRPIPLPYTTLFRSRYSCTSALVRTNWSQSTVTGSASVGAALAGPKKVSVKAYDADGTRSLVFSLTYPLSNRSEEHTSELQSRPHLVCCLLLDKKNM